MGCGEAATIFCQNLLITAKVGGFLAAVEALLKCFEQKFLLNILPE